jgi:polyphosphate kinase
MPGVSERIRVRSIIGRYLEHSRIFSFANGGNEEMYCGSADWMPRNLFERCEVVFPVKDPALISRLRDEILAAELADSIKTRLMRPNGSYGKLNVKLEGNGLIPFSSQDFFMELAEGRASIADIPDNRLLESPALVEQLTAGAEPTSPHPNKPRIRRARTPNEVAS